MNPFSIPAVLALSFSVAGVAAAAEPQRSLLIACAADAPAAVVAAAGRLQAAAATSPLLIAFAEGRAVPPVADSRALATGKREALAYRHVVVVGLPDDPLVAQAWQHEARVVDGGLEAFGFGVLHGAIGWSESGANPWLHSPAVGRPPYECETVVVSGTTPDAVALAADALLRHGLVNGAVAAAGWTRPETTLLDQAPALPDAAPPAWLAAESGGWTRIAVTWCAADVARGISSDAGAEPDAVWLAKYHRAGVWDGAGAESTFVNFAGGLHRRAFLNALLLAHFPDAGAAARAVGKVAQSAKLKSGKDGILRGSLRGYQDANAPSGSLACWARGEWLVMSSLPADLGPEDLTP